MDRQFPGSRSRNPTPKTAGDLPLAYSRNVNPMDAAGARTEVHLPPGPPEGARRRASEAEKAEKAMIGQILPPYVVAVDTTDDPPDAFLFPRRRR